MFKLFPALALFIFITSAPLRAEDGSAALEARFHNSLSEVVREVRNANTPMEKRIILQHFLTKMENGMEKAQGMAILNTQDRQVVQGLQKKFLAYDAELNGQNGLELVADAKLDAFAGYIQQDMEQANHGGGIYLSASAIIIILLLLIIIL